MPKSETQFELWELDFNLGLKPRINHWYATRIDDKTATVLLNGSKHVLRRESCRTMEQRFKRTREEAMVCLRKYLQREQEQLTRRLAVVTSELASSAEELAATYFVEKKPVRPGSYKPPKQEEATNYETESGGDFD